MKQLAAGLCLALWAAVFPGCAPLTFSEQPRVDFDTYRSVAVSVSAPAAGDPNGYLVDELRKSSGFASVSSNRADPPDLYLDVQVTTSPELDDTTRFEAAAEYRATTSAGRVVDQGTERQSGSSPEAASLNALDEVVVDFIAPFRL